MDELLKKFFHTGVGIAALTAEKLQEMVDDLVGKGNVSEEEGKKIVDDFKDKADTRKEEFEQKLKEIVENVKKGTFFPKFMSAEDFENLLKRIEALEEKVGIGTPEDVKEAVAEVKEEVKKEVKKRAPRKKSNPKKDA